MVYPYQASQLESLCDPAYVSGTLSTLPIPLSMTASRPAAGTALAVLQIGSDPFHSALACFGLFGILNPTDPLVASERGNIFPQLQGLSIVNQNCYQILWNIVYDSRGEFCHNLGSFAAAWLDTFVKVST